MHQLGEKIRKIRRIKNLSQLDVSEKIGLTQSEISKIENEEVAISVTLLQRFSKFFDMPVEDIIHYDEKVSYNITTHEQKGGANGLVIGNSDVDDLIKMIKKQNVEIEKLREELKNIKNK